MIGNTISTKEGLLEEVRKYNKTGVEKVSLAYDYANDKHGNQTRESGEPYIVHPLNVAYFLAQLRMDVDSICAGLLHDTLEDTNTTKPEIAELFGNDVANLVDGVTKISKLNFDSRAEEESTNMRKLIVGLLTDVRIITIKLCDRLHNMKTLQYKKPESQKRNSVETMEFFVPLAYLLGVYELKNKLEDLSFMYYNPEEFKRLQDKIRREESNSKVCVQEIQERIQDILSAKNILCDVERRTKNIYGVYKRLEKIKRLRDVHDLISFKIIVDDVDDCYSLLRPIHEAYAPLNEKFKDYIARPKTNMYQSIHTTVFGPEDRLAQFQIRTKEMDLAASYGIITRFWGNDIEAAKRQVQAELRSKYQFFEQLEEINKMFGNNQSFISQTRTELFSDHIYVTANKGKTYELPVGATVVDLAYKMGPNYGDHLAFATVNDEDAELTTVLHNQDRVKIVNNEIIQGPNPEWATVVKTTLARTLIIERTHQ